MGKNLKGKELGEGISQRKNGLYQARYTDRFGNRKAIYSTDLKKIREKLAKAIADNSRNMSVREDLELDQWFERWMEIYKEKSIRPNTKREYVHIYSRDISPQIGGRNISSLVKSDIQQVVDAASDRGLKYERQYKIRCLLHDMLQRAVEDQLVVSNPVCGIKLRDDKKINAKALTVEQQHVFFDFCCNTFYDNLFNVAVNTGLRPGELFALTESDIHFDDGYINVNKTLVYQKYLTDDKKTFHIEPPKTKQSLRNVPINSVCRIYLQKQIDLKGIVSKKWPKEQNDYLFVTKFNTPLNSVIYADAIRAVIKKINLLRDPADMFPEFSGHTFRHTFATRCFEQGIDAKVVQAYLGHASIKMTMDLYTHVTADKSATEIEKIVKGNDKVIELKRKIS